MVERKTQIAHIVGLLERASPDRVPSQPLWTSPPKGNPASSRKLQKRLQNLGSRLNAINQMSQILA